MLAFCGLSPHSRREEFHPYPERGAIRHANGEVRKDGEKPVRDGRSEGQVVGDLVDREEEVLVGGRAEDVRHGPELP